MRAGRLRHRVTLQAATEAADAVGQMVRTWADVDQIWAAVEPLQGREYLAAQQVQAEVTTRIRIRYRSDVDAGDRIVHGTDTYQILSVINPETRDRELQLMCSLGISDGR